MDGYFTVAKTLKINNHFIYVKDGYLALGEGLKEDEYVTFSRWVSNS